MAHLEFEEYSPVWNPATHCWNYPWIEGDNVEWLNAEVWMYRHRQRRAQRGLDPDGSSEDDDASDVGNEPEQQAEDGDVGNEPEQQAEDGDVGRTTEQQAEDGDVGSATEQQAAIGDVGIATEQQAEDGDVGRAAEQQAAIVDVGDVGIAAEQQALEDGDVGSTPYQQAEDGDVGSADAEQQTGDVAEQQAATVDGAGAAAASGIAAEQPDELITDDSHLVPTPVRRRPRWRRAILGGGAEQWAGAIDVDDGASSRSDAN